MSVDENRSHASDTERIRAPGRLFWARLGLAWEGFWPAFWPVAGLIASFAGIALLDGFSWLPGWLHAAVLAAVAGLLACGCWRAVRAFRWPSHRDAVRRLQTDSELRHRPLEALEDRLPEGVRNPASVALWAAHQRRMAESVARLRVRMPAPGLASRDPWSVRMAVLLLLVVGVGVAGSEAPERLRQALVPDLSGSDRTTAVALQLWITPPDYTLEPPIFLQRTSATGDVGKTETVDPGSQIQDDDLGGSIRPAIEVPAGSIATAIVSGGKGDALLEFGEEKILLEEVDSHNHRLEYEITTSGRLTVLHDGKSLGTWRIRSRPDTPPVIAFDGAPAPTERGTLRVAYKAEDDYGLIEIEGDMRRTYERGTVIGKEVSVLNLPTVKVGARTVADVSFQEIGPHPWAGLPVIMRLRATDAAGQTGVSEELKIVLPEREFENPVAQRIIAERRRLTTQPDRRRPIVQGLENIARAPGEFRDDTVVFLGLVMSAMRLIHERTDTAISPVRDLLWDLALRVEDGLLSHSERELARAQEALMRALDENAPDHELERLMRELQAALENYLRELSRQLANMPDSEMMPMDPATQMMRSMDLQRMLEDIRRMMMSGARESAREMLARLRQTLEALRNARIMRGNPQSQEGMQALQALQDLIRRQQQLMDRTFRQSQGQQNNGNLREGIRQGAGEQRGLREALDALQRMIRDMMQNQGSASRAFGRAGEAMEEAIRELDRLRPGDAVGAQGRAIEALQRAGRGMLQQMMGQGRRGPGMGMQDRFNPLRIMRDPLGREMMNEDGTDVRRINIPDQGTVERTQEIIEELRKRSGESYRPQLELEYINRLLQRF